MKPKRTFTSEFKRQVIEELLSGISTRAQISRKHNLSGGLINHWKEQYEKGKFGNEPTHEAAFKERIKELEGMIGRLAMDNDLLKKALQLNMKASRKKESLLPDVYPPQEAQLKGGAKC